MALGTNSGLMSRKIGVLGVTLVAGLSIVGIGSAATAANDEYLVDGSAYGVSLQGSLSCAEDGYGGNYNIAASNSDAVAHVVTISIDGSVVYSEPVPAAVTTPIVGSFTAESLTWSFEGTIDGPEGAYTVIYGDLTCTVPTPTPEPTTPDPTPTVDPTPTPTVEPTPDPTPTVDPTPDPTPTPEPEPSVEPTPTPEPTLPPATNPPAEGGSGGTTVTDDRIVPYIQTDVPMRSEAGTSPWLVAGLVVVAFGLAGFSAYVLVTRFRRQKV